MAKKKAKPRVSELEIDHDPLRDFCLALLREADGWIALPEVEAAIKAEFQLTERDRAPFKGSRQRWQNRLDWVKAKLTAQDIAYVTPAIEGVKYWHAPGFRPRRNRFFKVCPDCEGKNTIDARVCEYVGCGHVFPAPSERHARLKRKPAKKAAPKKSAAKRPSQWDVIMGRAPNPKKPK